MAKTLVGTFDGTASALDPIRDLQAAGVRSNHIRLMSGGDGRRAVDDVEGGRSWAEVVTSWFQALFEGDEDRRYADHYAEAYRRGHVMVVAAVDETMVDTAVAILNRHGGVVSVHGHALEQPAEEVIRLREERIAARN